MYEGKRKYYGSTSNMLFEIIDMLDEIEDYLGLSKDHKRNG